MLGILLAMGETDCESLGTGWLAQPVNALSSLAFSVVGVALVGWYRTARGAERHIRLAFVMGMIATGVGSFLFHGPQSAGSQFLHDITFLVTVAIIGFANLAAGLEWPPVTVWWGVVVFTLGATIVLVAAPGVTNVFTACIVILLVAGDIAVRRRGPVWGRWYAIAVGSFVLSLVFFVLGRTGNVLCDPESTFQGHGLWHVLAAVAIGAYAVATGYARMSDSQ